MRISVDNPPHNIRELCEQMFDLQNFKPVFTYGDTIYNPHKGDIDIALFEHEKKHSEQQGELPSQWWISYFEDPEFRYQQELEAYQVQYKVLREKFKDRNTLAKKVHKLACELSSPLYGNLRNYSEVLKEIKGVNNKRQISSVKV